VVGLARSPNDSLISCNYDFSGSTGGFAGIPAINAQQQEVFTLENALASVATQTANCNLQPGASPCVGDDTYIGIGAAGYHEAMHAHGYDHFEYPSYLCGIPTAQNPRYANSIPYIVQECVRAVLTKSQTSCQMHDGCGTTQLKLVDSVYASAPSCSCVSNPGTAIAPVLSLPPPRDQVPQRSGGLLPGGPRRQAAVLVQRLLSASRGSYARPCSTIRTPPPGSAFGAEPDGSS
jgi:hypothetical protein